MENVVTAVAWRPNGENFAVGSFNTVRLCDSECHHHHRTHTMTIITSPEP
jgi:hypothetical protein